eukprot:7386389-Prymnesium_polylepis.1
MAQAASIAASLHGRRGEGSRGAIARGAGAREQAGERTVERPEVAARAGDHQPRIGPQGNGLAVTAGIAAACSHSILSLFWASVLDDYTFNYLRSFEVVVSLLERYSYLIQPFCED